MAIPNFCGSTMIHNIIAECRSVSVFDNRKFVTKGGFTLPEDFVEGSGVARGMMFSVGPHSIEANMEHFYSNEANYNMEAVAYAFDKAWAKDKPVRMQKMPNDIFRVPMMDKHFNNPNWIAMVRNPYSHVESIFRKATLGMNPQLQLDQICYHAGRCLELQVENIMRLGERAYVMTYEDFCARPEHHLNGISRWMPELGDIPVPESVTVKGVSGAIYDDSAEKLERFYLYDPTIRDRITEYLLEFSEAMDFWGYPLVEG